MTDLPPRYSVEEANALLPEVELLVRALVESHEAMEARHDEVLQSAPTNGGGAAHREFSDAAARASAALERLTELGIVIRDPASGLVDFPALRDGREVYLCWRIGEQRVAWWHPIDGGFAGRQPLEE